MRQSRLWAALTSVMLLVVLAGCRVAPGDVASGDAQQGESRAERPVLSGGGVPPGVPQGPGGHTQLPPGIYLASFITLDVNSDYALPVAVGPNVGSFPAGAIRFVVVNKWGGLTPGNHREDLQIVGSDGETVLATDYTEFAMDPDHVYLTIASPLSFDAQPGWHQVSVAIDGLVVMRYQFLVEQVHG